MFEDGFRKRVNKAIAMHFNESHESKVYLRCFEIPMEPFASQKVEELCEYYGMTFKKKKIDAWLFLPEKKQKNAILQESVLVTSKSAYSEYCVK